MKFKKSTRVFRASSSAVVSCGGAWAWRGKCRGVTKSEVGRRSGDEGTDGGVGSVFVWADLRMDTGGSAWAGASVGTGLGATAKCVGN